MSDLIYTAPAKAGKDKMGFFHGSANAGALILMLCAWLLVNAPEQREQLWPYLVFGAVFIVLLAHLIHIVLGSIFTLFLALLYGIPLAFAGYWLGSTPYRWLEYACWGYAAGYAILVPRMIRALARTDARSSQSPAHDGPGSAARRVRFDLENVALAMLIVAGVAGLIMSTGLVARQWGLLAGIAAFVLWPITLLIVPWYAAIVHGGWLMLAVVYGGGISGMLLYLHAPARRNQDELDISRPAGEKP
jgi:hypothetical protein